MSRRRLGLLLAATGAAATMSLSAPPAFATGHDEGGGATVEEFVCFLSTGDQIRLGTGKVVTTPSGNVHVVCTGDRSSRDQPSSKGVPGPRVKMTH
jgi:hypothetical protein